MEVLITKLKKYTLILKKPIKFEKKGKRTQEKVEEMQLVVKIFLETERSFIKYKRSKDKMY
jgi:hypothetical protein